MRAMGIDIGTTKICVTVIDTEAQKTVCVKSENNAFLPTALPYEKIQSPERILQTVKTLMAQAVAEAGEPAVIGVTGQMHGIVYLDEGGRAISPLYTWQDARANEPCLDGKSSVRLLQEMGFSPIAAGYGCATHFHNLQNGLMPKGAKRICTIHDYVAMTLCGRSEPLMHASDAASLGMYDWQSFSFCRNLPFDRSILAEVTNDCELLGKTATGIPVAVAIGDNQASFLGAAEASEGSVLLNIGTGSQISVCTRYGNTAPGEGLELRPLYGDLCLWVGASLCGGRAFAMLEHFFREVLTMCGADDTVNIYEAMQRQQPTPNTLLPTVSPLFAGSRAQPDLRGSITGLDIDNFTPANLVHGFLSGMVEELHGMYPGEQAACLPAGSTLYGAGNGIRRNPPMREIIRRRFGAEPSCSPYTEEGAAGAAKFACMAIR